MNDGDKHWRIMEWLLDNGPQNAAAIRAAFPPGSGHFARLVSGGQVIKLVEPDVYAISASGAAAVKARRRGMRTPIEGSK